MDGLETIIVKRQIPVIHILLSIDSIPDTSQIGFVYIFHISCRYIWTSDTPDS